jgi:hypothetical protein
VYYVLLSRPNENGSTQSADLHYYKSLYWKME